MIPPLHCTDAVSAWVSIFVTDPSGFVVVVVVVVVVVFCVPFCTGNGPAGGGAFGLTTTSPEPTWVAGITWVVTAVASTGWFTT